MPEAVRNDTEEYWRPVQSSRANMVTGLNESTCDRCGTEYALGARFCYVCGSERGILKPNQPSRLPHLYFTRFFNLYAIKERLGLTGASLVLMVIGFGCVLASILSGVLYMATTVIEWQAVQTWRIEWLLAALVTFAAAILLNNRK